MSYKWKEGDWVTWGAGGRWCISLSAEEVRTGMLHTCGGPPDRMPLADMRPVIVRPKPLPQRIKRSELRAWFERQAGWRVSGDANPPYKYMATCEAVLGHWLGGPTLEAAILALRKALRKAGKFTP